MFAGLRIIKNRIARRFIKVRKDLVCRPIQKGACIHVFWKVLDIGAGPAASLYIHDREVIRCDCFGEGRGHYHIHVDEMPGRKVERVYFPETTIKSQIESSVKILSNDLLVYLQKSHDQKIRDFKIDRKKFDEAVRWTEKKMLEYSGKALNRG